MRETAALREAACCQSEPECPLCPLLPGNAGRSLRDLRDAGLFARLRDIGLR